MIIFNLQCVCSIREYGVCEMQLFDVNAASHRIYVSFTVSILLWEEKKNLGYRHSDGWFLNDESVNYILNASSSKKIEKHASEGRLPHELVQILLRWEFSIKWVIKKKKNRNKSKPSQSIFAAIFLVRTSAICVGILGEWRVKTLPKQKKKKNERYTKPCQKVTEESVSTKHATRCLIK